MRAFLIDVVRLTVWLAILVAIFVPLERLLAARPQKVWRAQTGVDLAWYFINSLLVTALVALPLALVARTIQGFDPAGFYSAVAAWPIGLKLLAAFVVNDVGAYWMHRWQHCSPRLWAFHAVHHSAEQLDWLVNTRAHPLDMVLVRLAGLIPVYLLGLASATGGGFDPVVAWVGIIGTVWSFMIHANTRLRFGPLEHFVTTPAFHHWHHTNCGHRDRNFAAVFPLLDRIFGTLHLPAGLPATYGVDASVSPRLIDQFVDPFLGDRQQAARKATP